MTSISRSEVCEISLLRHVAEVQGDERFGTVIAKLVDAPGRDQHHVVPRHTDRLATITEADDARSTLNDEHVPPRMGMTRSLPVDRQ
ncbi:MAG: hypothetical protein E6501_07010 [Bradyrhizobium sp.]|nr:hypothetical protein [Bradyrhizobium sp.]MDU6668364.1 hypothetical protein [Bradyrhizobium sp.]MDU6832763.1 hypothetical protein [Bradyrhizobium sp.]